MPSSARAAGAAPRVDPDDDRWVAADFDGGDWQPLETAALPEVDNTHRWRYRRAGSGRTLDDGDHTNPGFAWPVPDGDVIGIRYRFRLAQEPPA